LAIHAISIVANAAVIVPFAAGPLGAPQAQIFEAARTVQDKRCDEIIIMTSKGIGRKCRVMKNSFSFIRRSVDAVKAAIVSAPVEEEVRKLRSGLR
jgi:hypothetical protein